MVTYVLGAGASRHAGYPLASNLGTDLRKWIHDTQTADSEHRIHIDQIHELYGGLGNIEEILTDLNEHLDGSRAATLESHIRPYLLSDFRESIREFFNGIREQPAGHYRRLVLERIRPGDAIITFNYDMACERELRASGLWEIGDGYGFSLGLTSLPLSRVSLLKLHGSTNWFGLHFGGILGASQFSSVLNIRPCLFFHPDFLYLGYSDQVRDPLCANVDRSSGVPAMIMPLLHKRFFQQTVSGREWEPFWDHIWGQAAQALESSEKIVLIGYGLAASDERARHLLFNWSNPKADILVFSGSRTAFICDEFRKNGLQKVRTAGKSHFEDFLEG